MSVASNAIESRNVELRFSKDAGVFDQSYTVRAGSILGMIGPSGCGKTTTVRLALGLLRPQSGSVRVFDKDPATFGPNDREQIGYIPQQFVLYPNLSVAENAEFVSSLYGMPRATFKQRLPEMLRFVDMEDARNRLGKQLSGGMQRRLMLAGALMHDPTILFADEPTAGIDPVLRGRFWQYFRTLRDQGRTLVVTTQIVSEAVYCDYVAVMRKGRLLDVDTPLNLRRKALGGEQILLQLADAGRIGDALTALQRFEPAREVNTVPNTDNQLLVTVDDAGEWLPEVLNVLEDASGPNINVQRAEELEVSYDDVFIKLMEQQEAAHG